MLKKLLLGLIPFIIIIIVAIMIMSNQQKEEAVNKHEELVALGDSLTHGVGDESGEGYTDNLQKVLTDNQHDTVTVHNYGIPGQQTDGLLAQIQDSDVRERINNADYLIIFIGTNDLIKHNGGDLTEINEERILEGKKDYTNNLEDILSIIREENADVPVLFLGLFNPYPDSDEMEEVVTNWNKNTQDVIGEDERTKFISTNDLFKEKSTEYFSDELHPNEHGYDLITQKILSEYDF